MLKHGRIGLMRPEQFPKPFNIYGQDTESSIRGRERLKAPALKASVRCILSVATPEEKMMYSQTGVAVSHKIIQRGAPIAKEQDTFVWRKAAKKRAASVFRPSTTRESLTWIPPTIAKSVVIFNGIQHQHKRTGKESDFASAVRTAFKSVPSL